MTGARDATSTLVVGLGSRDRGDDAVGPEVAARVRELLGSNGGPRVVEHEDPAALLEAWAGADLAVVVDAVRTGGEPGAVVVLEAGQGTEPLTQEPWAGPARGGTHAFGLAAAIELARALDRLPRRLVVVGVEATCWETGTGLSEPVAAACPRAVAAVLEAVPRAGGDR
ncbi:MAG TPA: hydrogenase maturation protease [Jiangellales bacterium]|nr:hydrogenase maturation protease [Jiangellales bacterium]